MRGEYMSLWYPFRSREVADITTHLTPEEKELFKAWGNREGAWYGRRVGIIVVCTTLFVNIFVHSFFVSFFATLILTLTIIQTIYGSYLKGLRKKWREFLCSSEYARHAGYRPESLRVYQFWF